MWSYSVEGQHSSGGRVLQTEDSASRRRKAAEWVWYVGGGVDRVIESSPDQVSELIERGRRGQGYAYVLQKKGG
jgi:hypothetical protein